jgi:hypothetical protein
VLCVLCCCCRLLAAYNARVADEGEYDDQELPASVVDELEGAAGPARQAFAVSCLTLVSQWGNGVAAHSLALLSVSTGPSACHFTRMFTFVRACLCLPRHPLPIRPSKPAPPVLQSSACATASSLVPLPCGPHTRTGLPLALSLPALTAGLSASLSSR